MPWEFRAEVFAEVFFALNVPAKQARKLREKLRGKLREKLRPELPPLQNRNFDQNFVLLGAFANFKYMGELLVIQNVPLRIREQLKNPILNLLQLRLPSEPGKSLLLVSGGRKTSGPCVKGGPKGTDRDLLRKAAVFCAVSLY